MSDDLDNIASYNFILFYLVAFRAHDLRYQRRKKYNFRGIIKIYEHKISLFRRFLCDSKKTLATKLINDLTT